MKKNMMLVSVTNNKTHIIGYIDVCQFTHTFSVAEGIAEDLIIGRDFLFRFNCRLEFKINTLVAHTEHRVLALKESMVPPKTSKLIPVSILRCNDDEQLR